APSVAKESAPALEPEEIFFDASEDAFPLVEPAPSKAHASAPQESPRTAAPRVTTPPAPEHASAPQGSPQTAAPRVT
ncbi:hypothetical protein ACE4Z7_25435, partial [Salmonella enterica]|uniref:hypothetical protein n=1 Tax=Salmonella enterica TaxID=28901 RepID=UPI003D26CC8D